MDQRGDTMGDYRQLTVWQVAHEMVLEIYSVTRSFPDAERWRLTDQLCRSAASVPANIAEGAGRNSDAELARFIRIALGSANETEYHLRLATDLGYLPEGTSPPLEHKVDQVKRMLAGLLARLTKNQSRRATATRRQP
ncbi:MAG: four helix bundle protein [Gemmatimonadales bacterium]